MSDAHADAVTAPGAHAAAHDHPDIEHHVRAALVVFGCLLVLTGLTVAASYMHLPHNAAIALALAIAVVKGTLVVCWFMHLISERKLIYGVLSLTTFFFFAVLLMPYWTAEDRPHLKGGPAEPAVVSAPEAPAAHAE